MTYEEANSVKHLAQPCNEVLEKLDVECPKCNGTGKVKYSWTPKVGEWAIPTRVITRPNSNCPVLISGIQNAWDGIRIWYSIPAENCAFNMEHDLVSQFIPILHWEEIERVLKEAGYFVFIRGDIHSLFECQINKIISKPYLTRQEAVMLAIIELGKEL